MLEALYFKSVFFFFLRGVLGRELGFGFSRVSAEKVGFFFQAGE